MEEENNQLHDWDYETDGDFEPDHEGQHDLCAFCGQEEFLCECGLDYCCFDPRYTGPKNHCACKEHAEGEHNALKWYQKLGAWFYNKGMKIKLKIRDFNDKSTCHNCEKEYLTRKQKDLVCPNCGVEDMPF